MIATFSDTSNSDWHLISCFEQQSKGLEHCSLLLCHGHGLLCQDNALTRKCVCMFVPAELPELQTNKHSMMHSKKRMAGTIGFVKKNCSGQLHQWCTDPARRAGNFFLTNFPIENRSKSGVLVELGHGGGFGTPRCTNLTTPHRGGGAADTMVCACFE